MNRVPMVATMLALILVVLPAAAFVPCPGGTVAGLSCRCYQGYTCDGSACKRRFMPDEGTAEVFEHPVSCTECRCHPTEEQRLPLPNRWAEWDLFARRHGCCRHPEFWRRVDRQFDRFRQIGITRRMLDEASGLPRTRSCSTLRLNECWPDEVRDIIASVLDSLKITAELRFVFNDLDEPRVLAPDIHRDVDVRLISMLRGDNVDSVRIMCTGHPAIANQSQRHSFFYRPGTSLFTFSLLPVVGNAAMPGCFADIAVPTGYGGSLCEEPPANLLRVPWAQKLRRIFWRGTSSGSLHTETDFDISTVQLRHREHMHATFRGKSDDVDVGIVNWLQCSPRSLCSYLEQKLGTVGHVQQEQYPRYRYLLDMDGNSFSQRLVFLLRHTGSLVIRMSLFDQWESLLLTPMVHYVPTDFTPAGLERVLQWARANDNDAQRIAESGRDFAKAFLRKNDAACYWFRVIMLYEDAVARGTARDTGRADYLSALKTDSTL